MCGLTTEAIARAFLTAAGHAGAAHRAGQGQDPRRRHSLPGARRATICRSGWRACCTSSIWCSTKAIRPRPATTLTRPDLSSEAIRLGRLLVELLPEPEVLGLLALMLLQESRRAARTSPAGDLILLEDQDRALWDREQIAEGAALVERALRSRRFGALHAAGGHCGRARRGARTPQATDWAQIVGLYDVLLRVEPSPVVAAEPRRGGGDARRAGRRARADRAADRPGGLGRYHLAHAARADLLRRLGRRDAANRAPAGTSHSQNRGPSSGSVQRRLAEMASSAKESSPTVDFRSRHSTE